MDARHAVEVTFEIHGAGNLRSGVCEQRERVSMETFAEEARRPIIRTRDIDYLLLNAYSKNNRLCALASCRVLYVNFLFLRISICLYQ